MRTTTTRIIAVLTALLIVTAAAACSSSKKSDAGGTATTTCQPSAKLPDKIKSAGAITVATDASYAPNEFFADDGTTIQGMDVDMGKAIGEVLCVKVNFVNAKFDDIIPGLGTRFDLGISSFTDTQERQQTVDFVTYFSAGTSFLVQKGQNQDLTSLAALCGKSVGVETGTTQANDATEQSTTCTTAGKPAIDLQTFPDQNGANLALSSGRVQVVMLDTPVAGYQAQISDGKFEVVGQSYGAGPYGVAVPKSSDYAGMTDAILGALQQLNGSGKYTEVLTTWGVQSGAITDFQINGATS
jgi:polar amino acid transport system substrate-binding protein